MTARVVWTTAPTVAQSDALAALMLAAVARGTATRDDVTRALAGLPVAREVAQSVAEAARIVGAQGRVVTAEDTRH